MSRLMRFVLPALLILMPGLALAQAKINLEVQYPLGFIFDKVFAELKTEFEKANPDITVTYRPAYKEYEDAAQTALRQAITKQLPDVALQAINMQRLFVDRGIAVDVSPFIAKEKNWKGDGFSEFDDVARHVQRQAIRPRIRSLDADHLLQRRSRGEGGRRPQ